MDFESIRDFCLAKPGVTESTPFGEHTLVFKNHDKIFALLDIKNFESINLKCDPEEAVQLREHYHSVIPGYHMNKKHWNTIFLDDPEITSSLLFLWITNSYNLVCKKSKKIK